MLCDIKQRTLLLFHQKELYFCYSPYRQSKVGNCTFVKVFDHLLESLSLLQYDAKEKERERERENSDGCAVVLPVVEREVPERCG
jgi:hypothetical protein